METEKKELIFAEGIRFFKPRENAPKSIKGNMVINLQELMDFTEKQKVQGDLRIDLRKSETKGTYYFTLNTWKPTAPKTQDSSDSKEF